MAYRRKYYKKKRYSRRTKTKVVTRDPDVWDVAKYAAKGVGKIFRMINVEYKVHDLALITTNVPNSFAINQLDTIAQGDTGLSRDGISIRPMNLTIRADVSCNNLANANGQLIRIMVVRGKHENGTALTVSDVLNTTTGIGACLSFKDYDKRFKSNILMDKIFALDLDSKPHCLIQKVIKLTGHINYSASDTTGATVEDGGLYLIYGGQSSTNLPVINWYSRLSFVDN